MSIQMQVNGPPRVLMRLGTEQQKKEYLPAVADGSVRFSIAMTEPQAGSDGVSLTTTLSPDGDGNFRLNGTKCHITGAREAHAFLVFCRAPETSGPDGIGAVMVEADVEGLAPIEHEEKMGGRGVAEGVLRFDNSPVRADQVILLPTKGSKEGASFLVRQFNPERCGNAAMSVGVARASLDYAIDYVKQREQFGRPILEFQGIQWKIADMATQLDAARLLLWRAARTDVDGFPGMRETTMAKLFANEMAVFVCNEGIQLLGHKGYLTKHPMERFFRDARGLGIGGGTTEILRNMIAGEVTGVRISQRRR
jgi:alkylation response protein AidB-like acyl-CoA dehydrogenase